MQIMVDVLELILLTAVVVELFWLIRLFTTHNIPEQDQSLSAKGQVINVNVGTPMASTDPSPQTMVQTETAVIPPGSPSQEPPPVEEPPADLHLEPVSLPVDRVAIAMGARATISGLVANKCAKCGMENSSFRTECFNCGGPLGH